MPEASALGLRIRRFRELRGLTQEQLSEKSGVSRNAIAGIETGQRAGLYGETALKLAFALGTTVEVLYGFDPLGDNELEPESERVPALV